MCSLGSREETPRNKTARGIPEQGWRSNDGEEEPNSEKTKVECRDGNWWNPAVPPGDSAFPSSTAREQVMGQASIQATK